MRIGRWQSPPIFYGWYIVAVAILVQAISVGVSAFAGGVFLKPMTEDLGWARSDFAAVQTVSQVIMGMSGFAIGGMLDRRGPRRLMIIGAVISGLSLVATAAVQEPWQFYVVRGIGQTVGMALVGNLIVNVTLARWFVARRGTAIAMAAIGFSLGGILLSPLMAWWIELWGWRETWVILGVLTWLVVIPCAFVMRRAPEDYGLTPDGMDDERAAEYAHAHGRPPAGSEVSWTRAQALRTRTLWLVIMAYGMGTVTLGALLLHAIPFLTDHGVNSSEAALLLSGLSWASLVSKFFWAPLMDRIHPRYLSAAGFLITGGATIGLIGAGELESAPLMGLSLIIFGAAAGGTVPLQETVWASYFGRAHLGSVRSVGMPVSIVFSAGGPLLGGVLYDATSSYTIAFLIFAACSLIGCLLILFARPPLPPLAQTPLQRIQTPSTLPTVVPQK